MAQRSANELRELNDERLAALLREAREALFNLRFQHASGSLEETSEIGLRRREIARLLTVIQEREREVAGA